MTTTFTDPFAPAVQAPAVPEPRPASDPEIVPAGGQPITINTTSDGKVVVTLKGGGGFDAPWIVIHASCLEDALAQLADDKLRELMDRVKRAALYFSGGGSAPAQQPQQRPSGGSQQLGKPAGADQAPNGEQKFCAHGAMTYRAGMSKAGKAYQGFFCPERDRSQQCKAVFV
jgi:hypothetical protein